MPKKFVTILCLLFTAALNGQPTDQWKVWVKTSPCSGRHDWISVAKENPTSYGLSYYELANVIFPQTPCTTFGCSFSDATSIANGLKVMDEFFDYCCRDYSVWENTQTSAKTVVVGKFGTAGLGWILLKTDLCCEEAEALSGISNACSGSGNVQCWPGSYAAWNAQTQRTECFCNPGLVWNVDKTACIPNVPDCPSIYANSEALWDHVSNQYLCYCKTGYVWNETKTACILPMPDCNLYYKNSVAVWDETSKQYLCNCPQGYVWNQARTECILNQVPDCNLYYKNSIAVWDAATMQYLCNCPQGYVWNQARTECINNQLPDCKSFYKNSYAAWDNASNQYLCYCNTGYVWNAARTECIPSGGQQDEPVVNPQQKKNGECNIQYKSGANEAEQYTIDVKRNFGSLNFAYETYSVKDRIHIYHGGIKVFDSGCVGANGSQTLNLNGASSIFTIIVDPKCDQDQSDTSWNFTLGCPN
ncbi:MAG TPA: hypothetical protein PLQ57_07985 [Saprospiraceae bacterium]|nr:hypothetical protein [Saprospiraceae bacterium]